MYFAIIGDIIASKTLNRAQRYEVQIRLKEILDKINKNYSDDLASKFLITIGDEFQGLLLSTKNIIHIVDIIQYIMYPIKIRFGLGIGEIYTDINNEMSIGADGPAYHHARKMIDTLKYLQKAKMSGNSNIMIHGDASDKLSILDHINTNLQLCSFIESKWSDKQRQLIKIIYIDAKKQKEAASVLEVTQSSVQRRLKTAGYYDYFNARTIISQTLSMLYK